MASQQQFDFLSAMGLISSSKPKNTILDVQANGVILCGNTRYIVEGSFSINGISIYTQEDGVFIKNGFDVSFKSEPNVKERLPFGEYEIVNGKLVSC